MQIWKREKHDEIFRDVIKSIIIIGWISLAILTCYVVYDYGRDRADQVEIHWHIAIVLFVIVLACSFFLQTILIEIENKNDLILKIRNLLNSEHRTYYSQNYNYKNGQKYSTSAIDHELNKIIKFLGARNSHFLYRLFRQIQFAIKDPVELQKMVDDGHFKKEELADEIKRNALADEIKNELIEFHTRDSVLEYYMNKKMQRDGLTFKSYVLPVSFFLFMYFSGFLVMLPLINSIFEPTTNREVIPLFPLNSVNVNNTNTNTNTNNTPDGIPLLVIQ